MSEKNGKPGKLKKSVTPEKIDIINILYVSHYSHMRMGGQKSMLNIIEMLDRKRFQPFAIVPEHGELSDALEKLKCPCEIVPMCNLKFRRAKKIFNLIKSIRKIIKEKNIHIIHSDQDHDTVICNFAKRGTDAKLIWHVRITRPYKWDRINSIMADKIIMVADDIKHRVKADKEAVRKKCTTVYNGVNCDLFAPADKLRVKNELNLPKKKFIVMFAGQIKKGKGIFDLVLALDILHMTLADYEMPYVLFMGTPKNKNIMAGLVAFIEEKKLNKFVSILPQQNNIHKWMQAADVLAAPSHEGVEGMGRVIYEAMACGTAVITTDISGNREAVTPETGLIVPQKSPVDIANAIKQLIKNKNILDKFQKNGRKRSLDFFDYKKNIKFIEQQYCSLRNL